MSLEYKISIKDIHAHIFALELTINNPNPLGQVLSLPNWIPGSYLIRDFAKNIITIKASSCGNDVAIKKLDKNHWITHPCNDSLVISYEVYAFDLSVRSAYLDIDRAFFNGTSVFLLPLGLEDKGCSLLVDFANNWQIATGLNLESNNKYIASNYSELIDHPFEAADLTSLNFDIQNVKHTMAISGVHSVDIKRLKNDLEKICNYHVDFFHDMPFDKYLFLTLVRANAYGGLEHRNSSSLICSRKDLPLVKDVGVSKDYAKFLSLCSHEYFHAWWIKTIKPASFHNLDLGRENYTEQLWIYEGFTSYYDELSLLRSGLISLEAYLDLFAQTLTRVQKSKGRLLQSLADSSYDAWTKFYQQDENAPNAIVSYYTKGALLAFVLDIEIRRVTSDRKSLDDVVKYIWNNYQKSGTENNTVQQVVNDITGSDFSDFFDKYLYNTNDLPLDNAFAYIGINCKFTNKKDDASNFGITYKNENNKAVITQIFNDTSAHTSGLYVGDKIEAINDKNIDFKDLGKTINNFSSGEKLKFSIFRDEILRVVEVDFYISNNTFAILTPIESMNEQTKTRQEKWICSE